MTREVELETPLRKDLPEAVSKRALATTLPSTSAMPSHEVTVTLIDTLLIVIVVIFLFLGSMRSVLVPVMAIPDIADRRDIPHADVRL